MENESRIVELLSEMLIKFDVLTDHVDIKMDQMTGRFDKMTDRMDKMTDRIDNLTDSVNVRFAKVDGELEKVKNELVKLNLISAENSRAILKLADNSEKRFDRLEKAVFKKG